MVSKSSAPHSIRFRNELWDKVMERAKRDEITPNEAVVALVEAGLRDGKPQLVAPLTDAEKARILEAGTAIYETFEPPVPVEARRAAKPKPASKVKVKHVPSSPTTWPSGVVIEPHHTEDPGIEAPRVTVNVPLHKPKAFNPQPKKGGKK